MFKKQGLLKSAAVKEAMLSEAGCHKDWKSQVPKISEMVARRSDWMVQEVGFQLTISRYKKRAELEEQGIT